MSDNPCRSFRWSIEPSDEAVVCVIALLIATVLCASFWMSVKIGEMNTQENLAAIQNGYSQVQLKGVGGVYWQKEGAGK